MLNRKHVLALVLILALVLVLNFFAFQFFWYWKFWWFDLVMHFLGGLTVGYLVIFITQIYHREYFLNQFKSRADILALVLISAFIVGGAWELFEFSVDQHQALPLLIKSIATLQMGLKDSLLDILLDLIGASVSAFIFVAKYYESRT